MKPKLYMGHSHSLMVVIGTPVFLVSLESECHVFCPGAASLVFSVALETAGEATRLLIGLACPEGPPL
jgi:hypothetical protein